MKTEGPPYVLRYLITIAIVFVVHAFLIAQSSSISHRPKVSSSELITIQDGLSHRAVTDVVQDKQGFLWIATKNGLNRYDGHTIINYTDQVTNPNKIYSTWIIRLLLSDQGHLVMLNNQEDIEVFDPTTDESVLLDPGTLISPRGFIRY